MNTTSASLLDRLRQPEERGAWERFVHLYTPLLYHWAKRVGLREHDAADLIQDVLALLVVKLPEFTYDRDKSFRAWLRTVTLNRWRERCRRKSERVGAGDGTLDEVAAPDASEEFEEAEYRRYLLHRAIDGLRGEFTPATWRIFDEHVLAGRDAADVAKELGVGIGSVYAAKSRVFARLRAELHGLLD
jgi:RNA polymerase sigma-70 factor (ECF subfamily)